jgi:predicted AAA+ superfamily ATPase
LLETLFLIHRLPAWSTNLSKRVVSRPNVSLLDTGLAARLVNVSPSGADVHANAEFAGQLLEGFVASEIRRQLTWSNQDARLFHYRDRDGAEIDIGARAAALIPSSLGLFRATRLLDSSGEPPDDRMLAKTGWRV